MADANGLNPGETGYDPRSDPGSDQYQGGGSATQPGTAPTPSSGSGSWFTNNAPPGSSPFTPVNTPTSQPTTPGGVDTNAPNTPPGGTITAGGGATGTHADPLSALSEYLSLNPSNPQAAIDQFNKSYPGDPLAPVWYPDSKTIGLANGTYIVQPGTGGNTGTSWQTVTRSGTGDGGLIAPFTGTAPTPVQTPDFSFGAFAPPSAQDVLTSDPGYGFRLGQGEQALQGSAAARGTLNTGGTLKDILNYGQSAASQEYSDAFNRALGTYGTNYNTALGTWQNNFNRNTTSNNYDWNKYLNDENVFWTNQGNAYSRLFANANAGQNAAAVT